MKWPFIYKRVNFIWNGPPSVYKLVNRCSSRFVQIIQIATKTFLMYRCSFRDRRTRYRSNDLMYHCKKVFTATSLKCTKMFISFFMIQVWLRSQFIYPIKQIILYDSTKTSMWLHSYLFNWFTWWFVRSIHTQYIKHISFSKLVANRYPRWPP